MICSYKLWLYEILIDEHKHTHSVVWIVSLDKNVNECFELIDCFHRMKLKKNETQVEKQWNKNAHNLFVKAFFN